MFTTALVIGFTGILLLLVRRASSMADPLVIWGIATLLASCSLSIGAFGVDHPALRPGLSTALLLAAVGMMWAAARQFARMPLRLPFVLGLPVAWLAAALLVPSWLEPSAGHTGSCLIVAAYTLATAREIARHRGEHLPSRMATQFLLLAHAVAYTLRSLAWLVGLRETTVTIANLVLLEQLIHTIGITFLLMALVKEKLELQTSASLNTLARQDGLTGIGNRRLFDERLRDEVRRSTRRRPTLALLLIDVDLFKAYNDALGHQRGDDCLRRVAQAIADQIRRPTDLAARYGGEEFAVVLAATDMTGAMATGERIRRTIEALAMPHPTTGGLVTVSVGVANLDPSMTNDPGATLLRQADGALYRAKAAGRNRVMTALQPTEA